MASAASGFPRTVRGLASSYRDGSLLPSAATLDCLQRIASLNGTLNAFITVLKESALRQAAESDLRFKAGASLGPLDGIPVAVKDLIYIEGTKCTAGSRVLADNVATYDAEVVRRLKAAGAVLIGTTNLHEFAAGTTNVNPHFGSVRNPWDARRMSGGSSGGSAAAVAAGMAPVALGTDTGGSVRIPAAFCGVLGLKPTYGRVSRLGVIPLAPSLDVVGVISASAWDAAALLQSISGHEVGDLTTVETEPSDYLSALSGPFSPPRIGVVGGYFEESIDPAVEENLSRFVSRLEELGCTAEKVAPDWISEAYDRWVPIRRAEATAFHLKWLQSSPELYGDDVRALLEQGRDISAVSYVSAINARPSIMERFAATMGGFDMLALPTTTVSAPLLDQSTVNVKGRDMPVYSALNRLPIPFNYVGCPVLSMPSGSCNGTPLGVQLAGRLFDEGGLLRLAHAYEERFGPHPSPPA
ncbi:MAG: amidase [Nitrososphaerota archaeon]|nr:amidase [Nitrososphaerota archaeon]